MLRRSSDGMSVSSEPMPGGESRLRGIDLREIARILRRHLWMVVATPAILVAFALVYVTTVTPLYTATSTIFIDPRRASVVDSGNQVLTSFGTDDATIESQVSWIQSVAVLRRVVEGLKLTEDPEFTPPPGLIDTVRSWFSAVARARTRRRSPKPRRSTPFSGV